MQEPSTPAPLPLADPTPLGLLCLAVGCAALLPIAFGVKGAFAPEALRLTAVFCLLFGAGGQLIAGLMSFVNKNGLGGTLFTAFSFNWMINAWSLGEAAEGRAGAATASVVLSVDVCFLVIFLVMTIAFGFYSKLLAAFLADIVLLYLARIGRELTHVAELSAVIAAATVALLGLALYIAFALVLQGAAGRAVLPLGGPLWKPTPP